MQYAPLTQASAPHRKERAIGREGERRTRREDEARFVWVLFFCFGAAAPAKWFVARFTTDLPAVLAYLLPFVIHSGLLFLFGFGFGFSLKLKLAIAPFSLALALALALSLSHSHSIALAIGIFHFAVGPSAGHLGQIHSSPTLQTESASENGRVSPKKREIPKRERAIERSVIDEREAGPIPYLKSISSIRLCKKSY